MMNAIRHWGLTPVIALWSFRSPSGLHFPKWELPWECECSPPHTPSHFLTLPRVCDVTPRDPFGPHPCNAFALTLGLPLGSHPCKPFCFSREPKARVATLVYIQQCLRTTFMLSKNLHYINNTYKVVHLVMGLIGMNYY